jgi:UPF0176 protein
MKNLVAAFYHFTPLDNIAEFQDDLLMLCQNENTKGTILLANEGINGTIAGNKDNVDKILSWLRSDPRLTDMQHKESWTSEHPFLRMKVKLKKEIVTLGVANINPNHEVGTYVSPEKWNELIDDPEVLLIDARNDYEVAIGTFKKAVNPETDSFRDFPAFVKNNLDPSKHKKIAMFCTGGIRCEKATSYMLQQGYEAVYHLRGGILKYLEETPEEDSLWQGECFVFDDRVSVDHQLQPGHYDLCHGCRHPITEADQQSEHYIEGVCCPYCCDTQSEEKRLSAQERQRQITLAKARGQQHLGVTQNQAGNVLPYID